MISIQVWCQNKPFLCVILPQYEFRFRRIPIEYDSNTDSDPKCRCQLSRFLSLWVCHVKFQTSKIPFFHLATRTSTGTGMSSVIRYWWHAVRKVTETLKFKPVREFSVLVRLFCFKIFIFSFVVSFRSDLTFKFLKNRYTFLDCKVLGLVPLSRYK